MHWMIGHHGPAFASGDVFGRMETEAYGKHMSWEDCPQTVRGINKGAARDRVNSSIEWHAC